MSFQTEIYWSLGTKKTKKFSIVRRMLLKMCPYEKPVNFKGQIKKISLLLKRKKDPVKKITHDENWRWTDIPSTRKLIGKRQFVVL